MRFVSPDSDGAPLGSAEFFILGKHADELW